MATGHLLKALPALAGVLLFGFAAPAFAETEPQNDTLPGAEGPLTAGVPYTGTIKNNQDEADWYYFYAQPQIELTIAPASKDCDEGDLESGLYGRNGYNYDSEGYLDSGTYSPIAYTTPPGTPQLYYFVVKCDRPESTTPKTYGFTIETSPSSSLVPGSEPFGAPVLVGEPNEFREQAIGPLSGGITYQGVTGTINDEDWFYFYTKPQQQLEISATSFDPSCSESNGGELEFFPEGSEPYGNPSAQIDAHSVYRIAYTSGTGFDRHYISARCAQNSYAFRIDPPAAIASEQCIGTIAARDAAGLEARKTKRKLGQAKRRHRALMRKLKRRIKHKRRVKAARRTMRRAKRRHRKRIKALKPRAASATATLRHQAAAADAACG